MLSFTELRSVVLADANAWVRVRQIYKRTLHMYITPILYTNAAVLLLLMQQYYSTIIIIFFGKSNVWNSGFVYNATIMQNVLKLK